MRLEKAGAWRVHLIRRRRGAGYSARAGASKVMIDNVSEKARRRRGFWTKRFFRPNRASKKPVALDSLPPSCYSKDMEHTDSTHRSIDITDLSDEAVEAVQSLVTRLRKRDEAVSPPSALEDWSRALREWAADHPRIESIADDSRESIYSGRSVCVRCHLI